MYILPPCLGSRRPSALVAACAALPSATTLAPPLLPPPPARAGHRHLREQRGGADQPVGGDPRRGRHVPLRRRVRDGGVRWAARHVQPRAGRGGGGERCCGADGRLQAGVAGACRARETPHRAQLYPAGQFLHHPWLAPYDCVLLPQSTVTRSRWTSLLSWCPKARRSACGCGWRCRSAPSGWRCGTACARAARSACRWTGSLGGCGAGAGGLSMRHHATTGSPSRTRQNVGGWRFRSRVPPACPQAALTPTSNLCLVLPARLQPLPASPCSAAATTPTLDQTERRRRCGRRCPTQHQTRARMQQPHPRPDGPPPAEAPPVSARKAAPWTCEASCQARPPAPGARQGPLLYCAAHVAPLPGTYSGWCSLRSRNHARAVPWLTTPIS